MPFNTETYATVYEAVQYFAGRLHDEAWATANQSEREKSLLAATRIIDRLNFKGWKSTVYGVLQGTADGQCPEDNALNAAENAQYLQFPRDTDTVVPDDIKIACIEIAYALLDGIDPDLELENLSVVSHGYGSVRTTFSRNQNPIDHLNAGVPSATAWRYLRPYLREPNTVRLNRV